MLSLLRAMEPTHLTRFIVDNDIRIGRLAEVSGVSRQHIHRLKTGQMEPTRPVMVWITEAACYIVRRRVEVAELFDLTIDVNEELLR
jgi:predicted transcriptional regulator